MVAVGRVYAVVVGVYLSVACLSIQRPPAVVAFWLGGGLGVLRVALKNEKGITVWVAPPFGLGLVWERPLYDIGRRAVFHAASIPILLKTKMHQKHKKKYSYT